MNTQRLAIWGGALVLTALTTGPAAAAWNNVFQVACNSCGSHTAAASPVSGCCPAPCPQQSCTTQYVQRSYYQPVTSYQTSYYYEPVTTYRTSYYYEPVTSYRYACYYDPCSCSYQQVAQPVTSYQLRSQCCPVTSYLQRCCQKPVTTYQQAFYYEPVTTCCTTSVGAPVAAIPSAAPVAGPAPLASYPGAAPGSAPNVTEQRTPPANPPSVQEGRDLPPTSNSYRQPLTQPPPAAQPMQAPRPASIHFDRIVSLQGPSLEGEVVSGSREPVRHVPLLFISAEKNGTRQSVTADQAGKFRVALASGAWLIYTQDTAGRAVFRQKVDVDENVARHVTLLVR